MMYLPRTTELGNAMSIAYQVFRSFDFDSCEAALQKAFEFQGAQIDVLIDTYLQYRDEGSEILRNHNERRFGQAMAVFVEADRLSQLQVQRYHRLLTSEKADK